MTPVHKNGIHHNNMRLEMIEYTVHSKNVLQETLRIKNPSISKQNDVTVFTGTNSLGNTLSFSVPTNNINLYGLSLAFTQVYKQINSGTKETEAFDNKHKTVIDKYYVDNDKGLQAEITLYYKNPSYSGETVTITPIYQEDPQYQEPISKDFQNLLDSHQNKNKAVKEYQMFNRAVNNKNKQFAEKIQQHSKVSTNTDETLVALRNLLRSNIETLNHLINKQHEKQ